MAEIDFRRFKAKVAEHKDYLSALMITYPSTYGFFDANVKEITNLIHEMADKCIWMVLI